MLTVIVPVYNRKRYVRSAVQSLLEERMEGLEILVVDDGSTDGSAGALSDLPVKVLSTGSRRGAAAARNLGVRQARGEFLGFLDSDDILAPGGLRRRLDWLRDRPFHPVVAGRIAGVLDETGNVVGSAESLLPGCSPSSATVTLRSLAESAWFLPAWLMLLRREFLIRVGPFDEGLAIAHDREFLFRLLAHTDLELIPDAVVFYRRHSSNLCLEAGGGSLRVRRRAKAEGLLVNLEHGRDHERLPC